MTPMYAAAISSDGDQLWYQNYGVGIHEVGATASLDSSGNLLLNGRVSEVNDNYSFIKDVSNFYGAEFSSGWKGFQLKLHPDNGRIIQSYTTGSFNSGGNQIVSDLSRNIAYIHGYTFGSVNGVAKVGNGDPAGANHYLIARDESSGENKWTRMENWIRSNILVNELEDALYFVDKGNLEKIQGSTGKSLWSKPIDNSDYKLALAANGGILMAKSSSNSRLEIQAVSSDGNFGKTQHIEHEGKLNTREILEGDDGFLLISGSTSGKIKTGSNIEDLTNLIGAEDSFTLRIKSPFSDKMSGNPGKNAVSEGQAKLSVTAKEDKGLIADSVQDYSSEQNFRGWQYGFYDGTFRPNNFKAFQNYKDEVWSLIPNWGPENYTLLYDNGGHPNTHGGSQQWAVRRWTSDRDQDITIKGRINDGSIGGGDGITGRIFHKEKEIYSQASINDSPKGGIPIK